MNSIMDRKLILFDYIESHNGLKTTVSECVVPGRRGRGGHCDRGSRTLNISWTWECMRLATSRESFGQPVKRSTYRKYHAIWRCCLHIKKYKSIVKNNIVMFLDYNHCHLSCSVKTCNVCHISIVPSRLYFPILTHLSHSPALFISSEGCLCSYKFTFDCYQRQS